MIQSSSLLCLCLTLGLASGQIVRGTKLQSTRQPAVQPAVRLAPAQPVAKQLAQPAAQQPAARAQAVTPAPAPAATTPYYPARFFGPGINNPAVPLLPRHFIARAQEVFAEHPNLRVFVGTQFDDEPHFTDEFGQEVEVLDLHGQNPLELPNQEEVLQLRRQQQLINARLLALTGGAPGLGAAPALGAPAALAPAPAPAPAPRPAVRAPSRFLVQQS